MPKIGLDAGHGGNSTGTHSCNTQKDKLYEKHHTLELVKLVAERLKTNGFETFLTRTTDINCGTVSERAKACVNNKCDYAVSIHFNGFDNQTANGCEVFVPFGEKGAGIEAGYYNYLGKFFKLRQPFARCYDYPNKSKVFDKKLNVKTRKFEAVSNAQNYFGFIRTAWNNGLSADLLEVCFLTNEKDFKTYTENKAAIADAIAKSIVEGYKKTYKSLSTETSTETKPKENVSTEKKETSTAGYRVGKAIQLKNEKLFVSSTDKTAKKTVSGTYYIWSNEVINGRVKLTTTKSLVGIVGAVTGWIDAPPLSFNNGEVIKLEKTPLYISALAKSTNIKRTGTFFVWDREIINGRIRITNKYANVGVDKQVTGWVNVSDI